MFETLVTWSLLLSCCTFHRAEAREQEKIYLEPDTEVSQAQSGQNLLYVYPEVMRYTVLLRDVESTISLTKTYEHKTATPANSGTIRFIIPEQNRQFAVYEDKGKNTSLSLRCDSKLDLCFLVGLLQTIGKTWRITPTDSAPYQYFATREQDGVTVNRDSTIQEAEEWLQNDSDDVSGMLNNENGLVPSEIFKRHLIKKRHSRVMSVCNIIEIVAIADNLVWEFFLERESGNPVLAQQAIYEHYDALFSEVDIRYNMVSTTCIRVLLIDVWIRRTAYKSWSRDRSGDIITGSAGATACGKHIFGYADAVACFTRGNIELDGDLDVADVSFFDTICIGYGKYSAFIAEDDHDQLARDVAQLILFLLGIPKDSEIGGDNSLGFISGDKIKPVTEDQFSNSFLFSSEAAALIADATAELNAGHNCLQYGRVTDAELDVITAHRQLAGEIINLDQQCQLAFGLDSVACLPPDTTSIIETDLICVHGVFCLVNYECESRTFVYNGSPCGCGQTCFKGVCIEDNNAAVGDECRDECNCNDESATCVRQPDGTGICTCQFGTTDDGNGNCTDNVCTLPMVENGVFVQLDGDTVGTKALLQCDPDFIPTSEDVCIVCQRNGNYSTSGTFCAACPDDNWFQFGTSCYFLRDQESSWQEALDFCDAFDDTTGFDTRLLKIDTQEELEFVKDLMQHNPFGEGFWNGLFQFGVNDGGEAWFPEMEPPQVLDWNPGEPNDLFFNGVPQNQLCTAHRENNQFRQADIECTTVFSPDVADFRLYHAFCELELQSPIL